VTADELLDALARGERRALARAITLVENRSKAVGRALARRPLRRRDGPGDPQVIGVTGAPGAGKSTFVDAAVRVARAAGRRVGVVAVDPSSPFSGGAILGDRIRMEEHTGDDGVFVRSVSSRGHLGGLSGATAEVVDLFDLGGYDLVVVETVGVGQSELAVMEVADTVVVVLTPESGDSVQAMKAGLLEVADLFVVNKADRPGADRLVRELAQMVALAEAEEGVWRPSVSKAVATERIGVAEVVEAAGAHLAWCRSTGLGAWERRRGRGRVRLALDLVGEDARRRAAEVWAGDGTTQALLERRLDPHAAFAALRDQS
jgi:LAO/AO transport system kinase